MMDFLAYTHKGYTDSCFESGYEWCLGPNKSFYGFLYLHITSFFGIKNSRYLHL